VAYPSGAGRASPRIWAPNPGPRLARDVEFLTRLIDTLVATRNVDRRRVYVNGFSNGGGMTFALSCAATPRDSALSATVTRRSYEGCAGGADVVLYTHGDGHVWPGGGPLPEWLVGRDSRSLNASELLWAFFRGHEKGSTPRGRAPDAPRLPR